MLVKGASLIINSFIPPSMSLPFVTQSSPIPTCHSVPPPSSQPPPSFNNVTPPSQSNMSNFNSSTKSTINSLSQTVSSLRQQIASMSQSKYNVATFDVAIPLYNDIIHFGPPKYVEVPQLEIYKGKRDLMTHLKIFQTLCSDFSYYQRLLTKLFIGTFRDKALQWYCFLSPYTITPFQ